MRWEIIEPARIKPFKYLIKFAWLPTITDDGKKIWLEKYLAKYEFENRVRPYRNSVQIKKNYNKWQQIEIWSQASTMWSEYYGKV